MAGKSILIIDTPTNCKECPLCSKDENYWGDIVSAECQMQYKGYLANDLIKPSWCPLRPLPQRRTQPKYEDSISLGFRNGWNACLEELEK